MKDHKVIQLFKPCRSNLDKALSEVKASEKDIQSIVIIYNTVNDKNESFMHYYWHSQGEQTFSSHVLGLIEYMKHRILECMDR